MRTKKTMKISGLLCALLVCMVMCVLAPITTQAATEKIRFSQTTYKKYVNSDDFEIHASLTNVGKITWTSSNTKVAVVDKDGNVSIVGSGKAKIKATGKGKTTGKKVTATANVIVAKPVFNCSQKEITLKKGKRNTYISMLSVKNLVNNYVIDWTSSDENIVVVNSLGGRRTEIVAMEYGEALITGTIEGVGSVDITVIVPAPELYIKDNDLLLDKDKSKKVSVSLKNVPSSDQIEWSYEEDKVSIVTSGTSNRTVTITPIAYGVSSNIFATVGGETADIFVECPDPFFEFSKAIYGVDVNKKVTVSIDKASHVSAKDNITWTVDDPTIVSIQPSGTGNRKLVVTGLSAGTATLRASLNGSDFSNVVTVVVYE